MTRNKQLVDGELYLELETVAEIYQVQIVWLREAYDSGLIGHGIGSGSGISIAAVQLDRVATLVRMHVALGLDIETILVALGDAQLPT